LFKFELKKTGNDSSYIEVDVVEMEWGEVLRRLA